MADSKYETPKEWELFIKHFKNKIHSLPIEWVPNKTNMLNRKDSETGRKLRWQIHGLDEGQKRSARFWLWMEGLEILTGLPRGRIFDQPVESEQWPSLESIEPDRWEEITDLILSMCRDSQDHVAVQRILSFFQKYRNSERDQQRSDPENKSSVRPIEEWDWIEKQYKMNRDDFETDTTWAEETARKFQEVFKTVDKPNKSSMLRYGKYNGRN